jgi:hypothetical protein
MRRHCEALSTTAPAAVPLYRALALAALPLGVDKGALAPDQRQTIQHLIAQFGIVKLLTLLSTL